MAKTDQTTPTDNPLEDAGQDITRELRALRADLAALAASLQRYGALGADEVKGRARDMADESLASSLKALREARRQVDDLQDRLQGDVRAHPLAWLVGALGLGMVLGLLAAHRR